MAIYGGVEKRVVWGAFEPPEGGRKGFGIWVHTSGPFMTQKCANLPPPLSSKIFWTELLLVPAGYKRCRGRASGDVP